MQSSGLGFPNQVSSIWLQFIWLAVGSTVTTRDLVNLIDNSISTRPFWCRWAFYSCRSATIGSTRIARRAGM
jgi:hypothetical protein